LPGGITARVAIEAGCSHGWHKYTGIKGMVIGIDHFGASAPYQRLYQEFGITAEKVVEKTLEILGR